MFANKFINYWSKNSCGGLQHKFRFAVLTQTGLSNYWDIFSTVGTIHITSAKRWVVSEKWQFLLIFCTIYAGSRKGHKNADILYGIFFLDSWNPSHSPGRVFISHSFCLLIHYSKNCCFKLFMLIPMRKVDIWFGIH